MYGAAERGVVGIHSSLRAGGETPPGQPARTPALRRVRRTPAPIWTSWTWPPTTIFRKSIDVLGVEIEEKW